MNDHEKELLLADRDRAEKYWRDIAVDFKTERDEWKRQAQANLASRDDWVIRADELLARLKAAQTERDEARKQADTWRELAKGEYVRQVEVEREEMRKALNDACDVAIWLSALVPHDGEAWQTWENTMRPKLFAAMDARRDALASMEGGK